MAATAPIFRHYETVVLLRPDMTQVAQDQFKSRIAEIIENTAGRIVRWETWGKRRLAYEIKKQNKAHYLYLNYVVPQSTVAEIERNLRILENVLKYQTVRLADQVAMDTFDFERESAVRTPLFMSPEEAAAIERNYQREQEWATGGRHNEDEEEEDEDRGRRSTYDRRGHGADLDDDDDSEDGDE